MPQQTYPSIFNDVIGPIMRGPSSSHCAAAVRIGRIARDLMNGEIKDLLIQFDPKGSLATTHESQGSDMGLFGGLLGWTATDERLPAAPQALKDTGVNVEIEITPLESKHPNTYQIRLQNETETHTLTALSTGGGIIEIIEIDGFNLSLKGDYVETLIYLSTEVRAVREYLEINTTSDEIIQLEKLGKFLIEIKSQEALPSEILANLQSKFPIQDIKTIAPVLPVLSRKDMDISFITVAEMLAYNQDKNLDLWELALHYEMARGGMTAEAVLAQMTEIVQIMQKAIADGIAGTKYADRILGYQSGHFKTQMESGQLLDGGMLNLMTLYTTALMESKSAMNVIVAAPTAGACGGLPGACIGAATSMDLPIEAMTRAMLAAGLIGIFIATHATFAAEVGGCQAECGAGSGMAAAALVTLTGGTTHQALTATSMALQNILGMVCDPVANRVEVPCLGKNVMAASNALACANMALAGYDPVIPLDEVIATMDAVGKMIPVELRCTALGGLSITPTSKEIEAQLGENTGP
jgi:L-serine dehydratase